MRMLDPNTRSAATSTARPDVRADDSAQRTRARVAALAAILI